MSQRYDFDLLCIGSGPAGQRAAVQAAKLGKRAAVIEKRRIVGGVCLDTGTIPSKTFREAVLAVSSHIPRFQQGVETPAGNRVTVHWPTRSSTGRRECPSTRWRPFAC